METRENIGPGSTPHGEGLFATTHWSVVSAAGRPDSVHYRQVLETLCQTYWFQLYAYLRRRYREVLRDEISKKVSTEDEVDQEIRDLFTALAH